ncbi:threonine synthase [Rubritalea squalenifaciens DSM 18772]|uniref:Threonine synthase n=1 Tax=Rubritalea squalenifaciens DSM 18772 TaxID=1123071 RepID=A0A1M6GKB3_9BACT|nr:threonine synthase [Rubritalea squalenifaciens]SHJ10359.1 threonine synthase [Rubritalea squalenifaciens DSM 18772]
MKFYSTNSPDKFVDLKEAVIRSLPADNGLYMPESIEPLPEPFWENWREMPLAELGFHVAKQILGDSIPDTDLKEIVSEAINFDAPLVTIAPQTHILELFHGPTLAFKDFGARFMARTMAYLTKGDDKDLTILVATSGDTGGAVASAFHNVPGTRVIILYPKGGVSALQEKQLTTLGGNITALEVDGTFDDCQAMVKATFLDRELSLKYNLTSANSINISRLIPQSFYYFHAARQLPEGVLPTFVIPSGNFGNLTAGLLAEKLGLPVAHWIAATNINDTVPRYLAEGEYDPQPSHATISNAMDVGAPSNFARMKNLFGDSWEAMRESISGLAFSDDETREAIRAVKEGTGYMIDPHGAVGILAAEIWRQAVPDAETIILETAHPSKFLPTMEEELGAGNIEVPERLASLADHPKESHLVSKDPTEILKFLG